MVNTIVGPIIAPKIIPENSPASAVFASSKAKGYPPMSKANKVVANIEGSAPKNSYTGTTTGLKIFAKTGANDTIPIIDRAKPPIASIPSSNF